MKLLEFCRYDFKMPANNKYLKYRRKCYLAWYYANGSYWQDDSGQVTQRSWLDLFKDFLPITEQTQPLAKMFIDDHSKAFNDFELTLVNDQYPPDFEGDTTQQKNYENFESELLKNIEKTVQENMKKYQEMAEVKHG